MDKEKLTPRKINRLLDDDDDEGPTDLSAESEVFDSDKDPDYRPSDEEDGMYKTSRLFEQRFQRQLEVDQLAGTSRSLFQFDSDEESGPTCAKKTMSKKTVVKKIPKNTIKKTQSKKRKCEKTLVEKGPKKKKDTDREEMGRLTEETNQELGLPNDEDVEQDMNEALTDEDDEDTDNDDETEDDITEGEGQGNGNKRKGKKRENNYKFKLFGSERDIKWSQWQGRQKDIPFTGNSGMNAELSGQLAHAKPIDYFMHFIYDDIVNLMVEQTNLYATQQLENQDDVRPFSRLHKWTPTTHDEMRKFMALIGYMGLVKYLSLQDYWSKNPLYENKLVMNTMSRNRFEILLRMWHFADNNGAGNNHLHKIEILMKMCIERFKKTYTPGIKICIDESMVLWRGRLVFRQYNPRKRHRYGIKLYKLCASKGYTWNFSVYIGQDKTEDDWSASENVIYKLLGGLLDGGKTQAPGGLMGEGRTLITDNWYTSVPLAVGLLEHDTHLIGTVRTDRKYLPPQASAKLKKGETVTSETGEGIVFLKWKDKRDVSLLSTVHTNEQVEVASKTGRIVTKPKDVMLYNDGKFSIDMSDQMATYGTALRRGTKWYRKLAVEMLWGMIVVNAHFLYVENTQDRMPIKKFRESIILTMLGYATEAPRRSISKAPHRLIDCVKGDPPRKTRGRCRSCYKAKGRSGTQDADGKKSMAKQVFTICDSCEGTPFMCPPCFNDHL